MTFIKTHIITILLLLGIIVLSGLLFRSYSKSDSSNSEKQQLKLQLDSIKNREITANNIIKSQNERIDSSEAQKSKLKAEEVILRNKVTSLESKTTSLTAQIRKAKSNKDTTSFFANCDSLAETADSLVDANIAQRAKMDSIQVKSDSISRAKDVIISTKTLLYDSLKKTTLDIATKYSIKIDAYESLNKKYKRERTLSRVLAGVGVALLGGLLIKK